MTVQADKVRSDSSSTRWSLQHKSAKQQPQEQGWASWVASNMKYNQFKDKADVGHVFSDCQQIPWKDGHIALVHLSVLFKSCLRPNEEVNLKQKIIIKMNVVMNSS